MQRYRVTDIIARQGLQSLQQVKVEGNAFISSVSSLSFIFLSPVFTLSNLSSPVLWETTQNDPQGLTTQSNQSHVAR